MIDQDIGSQKYFDLLKTIENYNLSLAPHSVGTQFQKIRDLAHESNNKTVDRKSQLELDAFNFVLKDGIVHPLFAGKKSDGSPFAIPDIKQYVDADLDYFLERQKIVQNPYLKIRYSQILWSSTRKNLEFAKTIIDQSLVALSERGNKETEEVTDDLSISAIAKNAFFLSCQVKYRHEELAEWVIGYINPKNENLSLNTSRFRLLDLVAENFRSFSFDLTQDFGNLCHIWAAKEENPNYAIDILKLGEKFDSRSKKESPKWQLEIGKQYEKLIAWAEQTENLAVTDFCLSAFEAFKLAGDVKKADQLISKYVQLKSSQKFGSASVPIDQVALQEHIKNCKERASLLSSQGAEAILSFLTIEDSILPNVSRLRKSADEQRRNFIFQGIVPKMTVDKRGHISKHAVDENELAQSSLLWNYGFDLTLDKKIQISSIVYEGISNGTITGETVRAFLKRGWLGARLEAKVGQAKIQYSWLDQVMPALEHYFQEIKQHLAEPSYQPQTLLSTDSLILKFEGVVRDLLARTKKGKTFKIKKDRKNRKITRESDLSILLHEPGLKDLFSENEIQFFKYLFTENDGLNLRGEIAHCLMYPQEYGANQFTLIFFALLRFAKFTTAWAVETVNSATSDDLIILHPTQKKPESGSTRKRSTQ